MRIDVRTKREQQRAEIKGDLILAAHGLVKDEGYEGLTMRKLAERVGLATMSVYSYFPDKQAILTSIARDAFVELAKRCAARKTADPLESLRAGLDEYVAFGLENPNEYRTIFMTELDHASKKFEELEGNNPAFLTLLNGVRDCMKAKIFSGDDHAICTVLWTVAHGAVSLLLTHQVYPFGDPRAYAMRVIDLTIAAMRREPVPKLTDQRCA